MKLKEITLSVFSVVMAGFFLLGSQSIHTLTHHSDDNTTIINCEQCDFIYTNNHTFYIDYNSSTIVAPFIFTKLKISSVTNYKRPNVKNTVTSYYINKPPPTA